MLSNLRFRQPVRIDGKFHHWHFWGFDDDGTFNGAYNADYRTADAEKLSLQYLNREDSKGKSIYEGDVVSTAYSIPVMKALHLDFPAYGLMTLQTIDEPQYHESEDIEIVGNIVENPELAKCLGDKDKIAYIMYKILLGGV